MSMLKQIDPASGQVAEAAQPAAAPPATAAGASPVTVVAVSPDARTAFVDAEKTVNDSIHRMEDAFTTALAAAEHHIAALTSEVASLRSQLDVVTKAKSEADAKLAVLSELKAKLASI